MNQTPTLGNGYILGTSIQSDFGYAYTHREGKYGIALKNSQLCEKIILFNTNPIFMSNVL